MQDRYSGDLGDFLKLGLLRELVREREGRAALRLGIVWYLVADESHNDDGKHVAYLDPASTAGRQLDALDPNLYERLQTMVFGGRRAIEELEAAGVLPPGSCTFRERLDLSDLPTSARRARLSRRHDWLDRAMRDTEHCDLIFVDPDNGLRRPDHREGRHRNKSVKHTYIDELSGYLERGQSVVAYHHADRSATVPEQAQRRMADVAGETGHGPLAAVRASRGTARLFLVVPAAGHRDMLADRLTAIGSSPWSQELTIYWRDGQSPWSRAPRR